MTTLTKFDQPVKAPTFRDISTSRKVKNHIATAVVSICFAVALIPLGWVLWMVVSEGIGAVLSSTWWMNSQKGILPDQSGGGVYHAIYGTIIQSAVAAIIAVPLGIMAAVYLVEYGRGRLAKVTTFMVDILAGVPSIVAALFIFALWIATLGFPQSAFAVSLALVLLMLPVVVRSTEEMLKLVPDELREASYALGIPKWKTIVRIVVPTALPGMISGILLSLARVMGETAPVLVLVGYAKSINTNLFDGNMASLPLLIYQELANPEAAGRERVWGAALTLILLIALLYAAAAVVNKLLTRNR
ncbi:phosphate ABC transporter permease PstA [Nocardia farcinica]|uniref:Phosphate transport system permease protein PstA n=1 Tax=Nocardia farcinica TaxID=37329 RepID=A0A0H5NXG5_NOCFR|nr:MULTISPECIES: phosphate ABC transporter permease PstA [Nocardia]SLG98921.1 phosphate ABC transporter permease [Mycobacteroides abscessus subsp. abscessus]AXK86656.1 phosphate ABC transporter permease PstA [Nocardia farcinica]MBA4857026.1 phosphate ABC transporter permease PstA [Nocardia farcinica]MBC9817103.1 phosphate ABC transporter permease PstA [Nocardia farcinica]MBF6070558.1 phosphate ABC transporter permease PstA [Nocardia farcinica]